MWGGVPWLPPNGWFIVENANLKWMMTDSTTPPYRIEWLSMDFNGFDSWIQMMVNDFKWMINGFRCRFDQHKLGIFAMRVNFINCPVHSTSFLANEFELVTSIATGIANTQYTAGTE